MILLTASCASYRKSPSPKSKEIWIKENLKDEELDLALSECGYNTVLDAKKFSYNEMAKVHICMIEKGFYYKPKLEHFCTDYYYLPACESAYSKNILK